MTRSSGDSQVRVISAEQARRLYAAHLDIDAPAGRDPWLLAFAMRLSTILGVKVGIMRRRDRTWTLLAQSSPDPLFPLGHPAFDKLAERGRSVGVESFIHDATQWTLLSCRVPPARLTVVAIHGDWTLSSPILALLGENISLVLRTRTAESRARLRLSTHRLARKLASAKGRQAIFDTILRHMTRAVDARIGALAIPDTTDQRLSIVATHGYPLALVEHVRIDSGVGVLGSVFEAGRALRVADVRGFAQLNDRRPRYRTDSFVAMPIRAGRQVLGVISVTDRKGNGPFTHEDLSTLRSLAAPAALTLSRERALTQAETYAHAAALDPVSGAFNRRHFHVRLEEEFQRSRRHQIPLALMMIDVDDFKAINDSLGHLAGDTVIKDIAEILRGSVRVFDVCARYGGEEFAVIMPGSTADSAARVAERIRERIESYRSSNHAYAAVQVTASIGVTVSALGVTVDDLIAHADQALYRAKGDGKNCVRVGPPIAVEAVGQEKEP